MKKIILLFVFAISIVGYSQTEDAVVKNDDFLIKTTGDTITGKFKYKSGEGDIKAKITCVVNDTTPKLTIKAAEVKYFKEGKNEYISFQPEGEKGDFLLKIVVLGKYLEQYEWQMPLDLSGGKKIEYVAYVRKKGDQKFVELDHSTWKKVLSDIIEDNEELADAVWKGKYKLEQLGEVVNKYNEWKEDNK